MYKLYTSRPPWIKAWDFVNLNGKLYRLVKTACQTLYSWISIDSKCTLYKVSEKMSLREDVMWILSRLLSFLSNCFFVFRDLCRSSELKMCWQAEIQSVIQFYFRYLLFLWLTIRYIGRLGTYLFCEMHTYYTYSTYRYWL